MAKRVKFGWAITKKVQGAQALHGLFRWMSHYVMDGLTAFVKPLTNIAIKSDLRRAKLVAPGAP